MGEHGYRGPRHVDHERRRNCVHRLGLPWSGADRLAHRRLSFRETLVLKSRFPLGNTVTGDSAIWIMKGVETSYTNWVYLA